jgi:HEAT repeat protein
MIEAGALVMVIPLAVVASYLIARSSQRKRVGIWLHAARTCGVQGLSPVEVVGFPSEVTGTKDGLNVKIERYSRGKHSRGTRVVVWPLDAVAPLRLRVEGIGSALRKTLGMGEVEVGDPTFDQRFLIDGPAPLALAVLDAATRQEVWSALAGRTAVQGSDRPESIESRARLDEATLSVEFADTITGASAEQWLPGLLGTILDLALNLARPRDVPVRLADNALHDPLWAVRLANLRTLVRECPTHPETARALPAASSDQSEEIRLTAAIALGAEGDATLLGLAFEQPRDDISARAVLALGSRLPFARAVQGLGDAVATGRVQTAWACVEALARGVPDGGASAEPHLIRAVDHEDARLRIAAAKALGKLGTARAVLPLRQAAERFGGEQHGVSRQAVAQIQARAVGATPGQLSLSGGGQGQVSLAEDAGGQVSLAPSPPEG